MGIWHDLAALQLIYNLAVLQRALKCYSSYGVAYAAAISSLIECQCPIIQDFCPASYGHCIAAALFKPIYRAEPTRAHLFSSAAAETIAASILYGDFRRTANVCDLRLVGIPFFHMSDTRSSFSSACCFGSLGSFIPLRWHIGCTANLFYKCCFPIFQYALNPCPC